MTKSGLASARHYGLTVSESRMASLWAASRDGKNPPATTAITVTTTTGKGRNPVVPVEGAVADKQADC